jgi:hypothetical protein
VTAAVFVVRAFLVDPEEVVAAWTPGHVRVLAQFDVPFGAQEEQAPVAPGFQAIWSVPVDAHVTGGVVAAQHGIAIILQAGILGMLIIRHLEDTTSRKWSR